MSDTHEVSGIVGRDEERALLARVRAAHLAGRGRLVSVEGDAGIGKTTLLREHAALARADGIAVIWARATEIAQIRPFGCLLDVLDCRLQHPDPARRRVAEAMVASATAVIDPFRYDSDGNWRFPVQEALVDLLLEQVDHGAVLLAIDDIQWADVGTLGVVQSLARRCASLPIVIAWSLRSSYHLDVIDQIAGRHDAHLTRLALGPLDVGAARRVGEALTGTSLGTEQEQRLALAAGNPFFIGAIAAHEGDDSSPTDAVLRWVATLPDATVEVLNAACVLGTSFDVGTLGSMMDRTADELVATLHAATQAGVVRSSGGGRYEFGHDLIRSTIEADLPASMRAALHRDVAAVLSSLAADPGVVAHHVARGARPGDEAAAESIRVACAQVVRHDASSAADLLGRAASLCQIGSPTWAAVMTDRVIALQWAGRAADALALSDEAVAHPMSRAELARVRMARATSLGLVNEVPAAADEYRLLVDDDELPPQLRAQILAELATLDAWGVDRTKARASADEALALARSTGALQAELQTLCALTTMDLFDGNVRDAIASAREAVTKGRALHLLSPARELYLGLALGNADELDESANWLSSGQATADAVADLWLVSRHQLARMSIALNVGEWESAVADAEAVISLHADTGMGTGMPQAPATAGIIAVRRGASGDDIARYRELSARYATAGAEPSGLLHHGWLEALVAEHEGRVDDATLTLRFVHDAVGASAPLVQMWMAPDLVRMLLAAGDVAGAGEVATAMEAFAPRMGVASARGTALLCRGLVLAASADAGAAVPVLVQATEQLRRARRRPLLLAALDALDGIGALATLGPEGEAERRALRAELGMRADDLGVAPAVDVIAAPYGRLTATETMIAGLVADGLSNPAIAIRLGLSKRTVEYHVSNVYVKLGVASRTALAAAVRAAR